MTLPLTETFSEFPHDYMLRYGGIPRGYWKTFYGEMPRRYYFIPIENDVLKIDFYSDTTLMAYVFSDMRVIPDLGIGTPPCVWGQCKL